MKEWSSSWESSTSPRKQRKYRAKAPYHQRGKFLSARLKSSLQENLGTKTMTVRAGDQVEVMRGEHKGVRGLVDRVDREDYKLYIDGVTRETVSGSDTKVPIDPSNVMITRLDLDDDRRVEKYDVTESQIDEMRVTDEDTGTSEDAAESDESDEAASAETEDDAGSDDELDYDEIVSGTIDDVKAAVDEDGVSFERLLAAEKANKDRSTLIEWIESQMEDDN